MRPRIVRLSDAAFRLHINATVYCNHYLTDGWVTVAALPMIYYKEHAQLWAAIDELQKLGLWTRHTTNPDDGGPGPGFVLEDFFEDQEPAAKHQKRLEDAKNRKRKYDAVTAERKAAHKIGNHLKCHADYCSYKQRHNQGDHSQCVPPYCDKGTAKRPKGGAK